MKKIFFIAAASMLLLSMTSCNKDKEGVYNPKQKISVIYNQGSSTYYYLRDGEWVESTDIGSETKMYKSQEWTWDGKQLQQIKGYTSEGALSYTQTFTYEKKKLIRVDYVDAENSYSSYATFEYDGKLLTKATAYNGGGEVITCEYTHTDKKITNITYTVYEDDAKGASVINATKQLAVLRMTLPQGQISRNIISEQEAKMKSRKEIEFIARLTLTWTGNNITSVTATYDGYTGSETNSFTYDTKKNPYHLYMDDNSIGYAEDGSGLSFLNENNILTARYYHDNNQGGTISRTYTYTYDKNDYPVVCTYCFKYSTESSRSTDTWSTTYEYVK